MLFKPALSSRLFFKLNLIKKVTKMNFKKMTLTAILLLTVNIANADMIDIHYNYVEYDYSNTIVDTLLDDKSNGYGITFSKDLFTKYFQLDISYEDLGESTNKRGNTKFTGGGSLWAVGARLNLPLNENGSYKFKLFGLAGIANGDFTTNLSGANVDFSSKGGYLGGGISLSNGSNGSLVLSARKFILDYDDPIVGKVNFDPLLISLGVAFSF